LQLATDLLLLVVLLLLLRALVLLALLVLLLRRALPVLPLEVDELDSSSSECAGAGSSSSSQPLLGMEPIHNNANPRIRARADR
jgi:hypothetical protein